MRAATAILVTVVGAECGLSRYQHDRLCIIRTRYKDYMIGSKLLPVEQDWLVTQLSALLKHMQDSDL